MEVQSDEESAGDYGVDYGASDNEDDYDEENPNYDY